MRFRKTLTLALLAMGLVFALPAWAQQKPFTRVQVQGLVRDGLGDESGVKLVEQRGIDFAPAKDFLQSLKAAGASEAFLKALRSARPPEAARPAEGAVARSHLWPILRLHYHEHRMGLLASHPGLNGEAPWVKFVRKRQSHSSNSSN